MSAFDRRALIAGAISGLFFALPAAILQRTVFDTGPAHAIATGVVFFAGALAGYGAARPRPPKALQHGAAAGVITFIGAQLVFMLATRDIANPGATLIGIIFFALVFASLGTIGAWVALASPTADTASSPEGER